MEPHSLEQLEYKHWNILDHIDVDKRAEFLSMFNKYVNQLPENDQLLLRTYYLPTTRIFMRMRTTLAGISKTDVQVLEDAVRELCADQPEQRIKKLINILNKAFKFTEPRFFELMTGRVSGLLRPDICVPGSNCHYSKDFLLKWVGDFIHLQTPPPGTMYFSPIKVTTYDHLSSTKAISPINLCYLEKMLFTAR